MSISFDGIGEIVATFEVEENSTIKVGDVVCLTGDGEVGVGSANDRPCGVAVSVAEDGYAGVQIGGMAVVRWSDSSTPAVGWKALAADGKGGVTFAEQGDTAYLVMSVDADSKTAVVKL